MNIAEIIKQAIFSQNNDSRMADSLRNPEHQSDGFLFFFLEYLAEKFDEIVKKHTANPNPILDTSLPEQRLPPPQPEKIGILFCCLSFFLFLFNRQTKGSPPTYHQNT